ncbi:acyl-CoA N-acyltransferase [Xylaria venustula]|nr:acyl-CoA N-acyltransferase [Xylaria venustula]
MAENSDILEIAFREAVPQDLDSLATLVPRSFFPANNLMQKLFPDTPTMRAWWRGVFEEYIRNPEFHLPVAIDTATRAVVGAITLRGVQRGEPLGGFMAQHPTTQDHPEELWQKAIEGFIEDEKLHVGDRDRFLIEVMGVDQTCQGKGIGKRLVTMVCEIADSKGYPIFLETSQAREFYTKQGKGFDVVPQAGKGAVLLRQPAHRIN